MSKIEVDILPIGDSKQVQVVSVERNYQTYDSIDTAVSKTGRERFTHPSCLGSAIGFTGFVSGLHLIGLSVLNLHSVNPDSELLKLGAVTLAGSTLMLATTTPIMNKLFRIHDKIKAHQKKS